MWEYKIERIGDVCKLYVYPAVKDLKIGGYGYRDVVVYKGAPVSFRSIRDSLIEIEGIEQVEITSGDGHLIITVKTRENVNCEDVVTELLNKLSDILIAAERDLTELEKVMVESAKRYAEKMKE